MDKGTTYRKRNFTPFAGEPYVTVDRAEPLNDGRYRINGRFDVHPDNLIALSEEESNSLRRIWDDCLIRGHVHVEGRVPCSRADGGPKKPVPEKDVRAKLFEIRMRRGDLSFQAYVCPDCDGIHIGRNPNVPKDTMETRKDK
jgi:hypothetical protein